MTLCNSKNSMLYEALDLLVFSIMILRIQEHNIPEISEVTIRMMGLDLVEKATIMRNHNQRGFKDSKIYD